MKRDCIGEAGATSKSSRRRQDEQQERDRDRERREDDFDRLLTSACIAEEDYCIVGEG